MIKYQPIKPRDQHDVERWNYPRWDNADHVVEQELEDELQPEEVEEISPPTAAELQQIRDDAYQEGYASGRARGEQEGQQRGEKQGIEQGYQIGFEQGQQQGFDEGHKGGLDRAQEEIDDLKLQLRHLIATLNNAIASEQKQLEQALVSMTLQLTQNLLLREISHSPELVQAMIRKIIDSLPEGSERIQIDVHPDLIELVKDLSAETGGQWSIQGNEDLLPGDCWVKTDKSLVDYSLLHRFRQQISAVVEEAEIDPEPLLSLLKQEVPEEPVAEPQTLAGQGPVEAEPSEPSDSTMATETQVADETPGETASVDEPTSDTDPNLDSASDTEAEAPDLSTEPAAPPPMAEQQGTPINTDTTTGTEIAGNAPDQESESNESDPENPDAQ